jgi:hypothetical protein
VWNLKEPQTINLKPGQACLFQNIWHRGEANPTTSKTSYGVHFYVVPRAIAVEIRSGKLSLDQTQGVAVYTGAREAGAGGGWLPCGPGSILCPNNQRVDWSQMRRALR